MSGGDVEDAEAWLKAGRVGEALMAAEMALAQRPGDLGLLSLRQRALTAIGAMDQAFAALQLDAAVNAERPAAHLELGHAYVAREAWPDAQRCFGRALALDPRSAEAHASLGLAYLQAGMAEAAERHSRAALDLDAAHVVASQTLASLLEGRGETAAAQAQLGRAYARQALFEQAVRDPVLRVLVLATATSGNVPYKTIMPPARYSRLVWYMEHARPEEEPDPDRYDVVFNTIGDADLAEASLAAVERFLARCPKPVLNRPGPVMRTRRDRTAALLGGLDGVVVPRTVRVSGEAVARDGLKALAEAHGFRAPLLARPAGLHGGQGLVRAETLEALEGPAAGDHYLIDYVDYRSADGLYRKYRVLFVGGEPFAYHQAISDHWLVHHDTAGMGDHPQRRIEEARFLDEPGAIIGRSGSRAIERIGRALELEYCGVDFSVLADGRVLVFEANATMLAHREDAASLYAYKNPYVDAIASAFQALLRARAGRP
jgi:Flp pilus assembly protein TadD